MIKRQLYTKLIETAKSYPIVTVIGPRQAGKTTLVQMAFPKMAYVSLEDLDVRKHAIEDPRGFLSKYPDGAILDEIQRVPTLFSYIQTIVDKEKRKGMFILTGSHQLELKQSISQSLAGRTAILQLLPLSLDELKQIDFSYHADKQLFYGFMPRIYDDKLDPVIAYRSYLQTYVERDLRQLVNVKDLSYFQTFLKLCAGRIGQLLNKNSLSNEVGVSVTTIDNWLSILEASHIIIRLQPYFENFGKRLVKSPKLYFTDVGLASYLLTIENEKQVSRDPLRGNLFENMVLLELVKYRYNLGLDHQLYFYRDNHHNEVDFIFKTSNELVPIEVKSAKTIISAYFKGIEYFRKLTGNRCKRGFLIYDGEQVLEYKDNSVLNVTGATKLFTMLHEVT